MGAARALATSATLVAALALAACSGSGDTGDAVTPVPSSASEAPAPSLPDAGSSVIAPDAVTGLMAALPQDNIAPAPTLHLAEGVTPPTNRWYSSLAFGDDALPVFASPLSFRLTDGGFTYGLPRVDATADTIFGSARDDVTVTLADAPTRPVVSAADPVAVELAYQDGDAELATINLAQGWPVVSLSATQSLSATLSVPFDDVADGVYAATVDGTPYALRVDGGSLDGDALSLEAGGSAQFFAVPTGGDATTFADALGAPVTRVTAEYGTPPAGAAGDVATTLTYLTGDSATSDPGATVVAMPMERVSADSCDLGTYETIDGTLAVCGQPSATWSVPAIPSTTELDLTGISDDERAAIEAAVYDAATHPTDLPADTYFGSKALYRLANLMLVAKAVGADDEAAGFRSQLVDALEVWTATDGCEARVDRCFLYDTQWKGVVGLTPAFGSEEFNDHHFHYGYLLYAAAVAGADDPDLVAAMAPVLDAVAADIAAFPGTTSVPEWRVFDPYAGHSWASGTSPFGDGNNQESSSEAVTAWLGLGAWAAVRDDAALESSAQWMTALEADAATRLWLRPDLTPFPGYDHSIVAIEWGGKRDYATWFSAEPGAMLGIQLIPAAPASAAYLAPADAAQAQEIRDAVAVGTPEGYDTQFGDFMLMYLALAGADDAATAWDAATALDDSFIDDGNSRAYMLAWIAAAANA